MVNLFKQVQMESCMFQKTSNLKTLRDALSSHLELPEYFLGIHAFFDAEVIFARDVVHVNMDLSPFPVDFESLWGWFREQIRGSANQETFAYELPFDVDAEVDPAMERLMEITRGSSKTIWMFDLAYQEPAHEGRRFVVVTLPDKKRARSFREEYHGRDVEIA